MSEAPKSGAHDSFVAARPGGARGRIWIVTVATAVILAIAITVFAAFGPGAGDDEPPKSPATQQSDDAYRRAMMAMESSQTDTAIALLNTAVKLDPTNDDARRALESLTVPSDQDSPGDTPQSRTATDPAPGGPSPAAPAPEFMKPVSPMTLLLPTTSTDFVLGARLAEKDSATVSGSPRTRGGELSRVLWTVYDAGSPEKAVQFVSRTSKVAFPRDAGTVSVDGASAYFGSDGTRFACIVYTRGRFVFETVGTVTGPVPTGAKSAVMNAARSYPDKL